MAGETIETVSFRGELQQNFFLLGFQENFLYCTHEFDSSNSYIYHVLIKTILTLSICANIYFDNIITLIAILFDFAVDPCLFCCYVR